MSAELSLLGEGRHRAAPCSFCMKDTFNFYGVCDDCKAPKTVGSWASKSGKWYVTLERSIFRGRRHYTYKANDSLGSIGYFNNDKEAIVYMQKRVDEGQYLPDSAKTSMTRII